MPPMRVMSGRTVRTTPLRIVRKKRSRESNPEPIASGISVIRAGNGVFGDGIGDVVVADQWAQNLESAFARETEARAREKRILLDTLVAAV